MKPPIPAPVPTWHDDTYAAIAPTKPELSVAGKTVIVTGAGSGIGRELAITFATAGAARFALLGRTEATLQETKSLLPKASTTVVLLHKADVTSASQLKTAANSIGQWDAAVLNAGYISSVGSIRDSEPAEWWQSFDTNVRGTFLFAQAFLPSANPTHASMVAVSTTPVLLPVAHLGGNSAYATSKAAESKIMGVIAAENPNVFAASCSPGMVDTAMFRKVQDPSKMPMNSVQLPAHYMLWLVSSEARFLNGRFSVANWDVTELRAMASEIDSGLQMTQGVHGWPFPHTA